MQVSSGAWAASLTLPRIHYNTRLHVVSTRAFVNERPSLDICDYSYSVIAQPDWGHFYEAFKELRHPDTLWGQLTFKCSALLSTGLRLKHLQSFFPSKTSWRTRLNAGRYCTSLEAGTSTDPQRADEAFTLCLIGLPCRSVVTLSIWKAVNKRMSLKSCLHLTFVWNRSRWRFSPTFIYALARAAPSSCQAPVLIHHSSSSFWINRHHT